MRDADVACVSPCSSGGSASLMPMLVLKLSVIVLLPCVPALCGSTADSDGGCGGSSSCGAAAGAPSLPCGDAPLATDCRARPSLLAGDAPPAAACAAPPSPLSARASGSAVATSSAGGAAAGFVPGAGAGAPGCRSVKGRCGAPRTGLGAGRTSPTPPAP